GPEGLGVLRGVRSEGIVSDCGVLPKARRGRGLFLLLEEAIYRCTGDDHARSPAVRPFSGRRWRQRDFRLKTEMNQREGPTSARPTHRRRLRHAERTHLSASVDTPAPASRLV